MFDLIDDLNADKWEDKGTPPDNWEELDEYKVYQDFHIINRKPHPVAKEITYVTSDSAGKTTRNVLLKDIAAAKNDPLKKMRHFHAIVEQTGKEEDNLWLVKAILTDVDWCLHK